MSLALLELEPPEPQVLAPAVFQGPQAQAALLESETLEPQVSAPAVFQVPQEEAAVQVPASPEALDPVELPVQRERLEPVSQGRPDQAVPLALLDQVLVVVPAHRDRPLEQWYNW